MLFILSLPLLFNLFSSVHAAVTVYSQVPLNASPTSSGAAANYTGAAAYDPTVLIAPPVPNPLPPMQFTLALQPSAAAVTGLSIQQSGSFFGFSIEMSVINQVIGINSTHINVPFLNLMANMVARGGRVNIRVGGNTQETAVYVDSLADGKAIEKDKGNVGNPTQTPAVLFTAEILYMCANISALTGVKWYIGIPFNDTSNLRLQIAEHGQQILGDNLIGMQAGNEPDLYAAHGKRPATYSPNDYFNEFGTLVQAIQNDQNIPIKNNLIGPSVATGSWTPEMVWSTNYIPTYANALTALAVEHYPDNNCGAQFGLGAVKDPQATFQNYLNHTAGQLLVAPYLNSANLAQAAGKPFLMFETNTASCGGFAGISDSFGAGLWALDYGFQMAYSNFSTALLHVGGQNVFYNPFTAPPTNQSAFHQWTIGPVYYSALIVAEAFGKSNTSQIIDLAANAGNMFTPAYAIYEGGNLARVALFNYISDPTGASQYTATINVQGAPAQVKVKYFLAPSVSNKDNLTWAGQTFGPNFASDGRLQGSPSVQTITCDQTANTCNILVPSPGFALVFLNDDFLAESSPDDVKTFATTALTKIRGTATVDPAVLATSNGHSGKDRQKLGGTSKSKGRNAAIGAYGVVPSALSLMAMISGAAFIRNMLIT